MVQLYHQADSGHGRHYVELVGLFSVVAVARECEGRACVCTRPWLLLQSEHLLFSDGIDTSKLRQNVVVFELLNIVINIALFLL